MKVPETREVNVRFTPTGEQALPFLALTNGTLVGRNSQYAMAAQRRSSHHFAAGVIQITEIATGRVLTISGNAAATDTSAATPANSIVGYVVARGLHSVNTPEVLASIRALFTYCWSIGPTRKPGALRAAEIVLASYGVKGPRADAWLDHPYWSAWLLDRRKNHAEALGILARLAIEPTAAMNFIESFLTAAAPSRNPDLSTATGCTFDRVTAAAIGAVMIHGWSGEQALTMVRTLGAEPLSFAPMNVLKPSLLPKAWLSVPHDLAVLAARAGVPAVEAKRMHRQGRLDESTLRVLAGLR